MPSDNALPPAPAGAGPGMRFGLFVALIAALMAVTPLGIDSMLPALPHIGQSLGVTNENHQQWVIAIYVFGFGVAQIVYGPLSDRFGRKKILVPSLTLFATLSVVAGLTSSFPRRGGCSPSRSCAIAIRAGRWRASCRPRSWSS